MCSHQCVDMVRSPGLVWRMIDVDFSHMEVLYAAWELHCFSFFSAIMRTKKPTDTGGPAG